ncbi:MAG: hypothetical protein LAO07_00230 [Acidobacteriia bacterium]|nr:hypothetical protein [Terriglobia bacterium]
MKRNSRLTTSLLLLGAVLSLPGFLRAGDREFAAIVQRIQAHYHQRPLRFMGLAGFFANRAHPQGVKSIKLAVFEDLDPSLHPPDADFDAFLQQVVGPDFRPFVRVWSRRDREQTFVYARELGRDFEMLVVTIERDEACVVKMKLNPDAISRWIEEPEERARSSAHGGDSEDDR